MIPYYMRQAPDNTSFYLFGKYNPNEKTGKQKRFEEIIKSSTEVRHIDAIPGMKFVFDENCQLDWEEPPRVINAQSLYRKYTIWKDQGVPDHMLLQLATVHGYTVVTKDRPFVVYAYNKRIPIVFRFDDHRLFLVENPIT